MMHRIIVISLPIGLSFSKRNLNNILVQLPSLVLLLIFVLILSSFIHLPFVITELFLNLINQFKVDLIDRTIAFSRLLNHAPILSSKGNGVISPQLYVLHLLLEPQNSGLLHKLLQSQPSISLIDYRI